MAHRLHRQMRWHSMGRSLNTTITWLSVGAAAISIVALAVLVGVTSALHLVVKDLAMALESVRVAEKVEVQLLANREAESPIAKGATQAELMRALEESEALIQSAEEGRRVSELRGDVEAYLRPSAGDAEVAVALSAARRVSLINVDQARAARQRAEIWDRLAYVGGAWAAMFHITGVIVLLVWLKRGPFRQVARLSEAMDHFHAGDLQSRAPVGGAREFAVMARSFNATAGALVRARQRQSEYVATAIHDLRTPLTAIQLAIGYLTPERPLPPEPRIRDLVHLIRRQLTRLNGLIGDVLSATWIEEGELPLLRERFDVRQIAAVSVQQFRLLAPEHAIELSAPTEPLEYYGDRARLAQVLNNLLSNAVKYSPCGSRVKVALARAGDEIVMAVADEGRGIAPEERERIFETFVRHSATHEEAPGTSLGLWVSRRVVEAHGGRIELDSRVGEGSTFRVVLPSEPAPLEDAPRTSEVAAPSRT